MIGSRIVETLARRQQEAQRRQEHLDTQARLPAERSTARATLAPIDKEQWWDKAQPADIASAYTAAETWKSHDPAAPAASEKIRQEVLNRYGIDTRDVGADAVYLESGVHAIPAEWERLDALQRSGREARAAAAEHEKAMARRHRLRGQRRVGGLPA